MRIFYWNRSVYAIVMMNSIRSFGHGRSMKYIFPFTHRRNCRLTETKYLAINILQGVNYEDMNSLN